MSSFEDFIKDAELTFQTLNKTFFEKLKNQSYIDFRNNPNVDVYELLKVFNTSIPPEPAIKFFIEELRYINPNESAINKMLSGISKTERVSIVNFPPCSNFHQKENFWEHMYDVFQNTNNVDFSDALWFKTLKNSCEMLGIKPSDPVFSSDRFLGLQLALTGVFFDDLPFQIIARNYSQITLLPGSFDMKMLIKNTVSSAYDILSSFNNETLAFEVPKFVLPDLVVIAKGVENFVSTNPIVLGSLQNLKEFESPENSKMLATATALVIWSLLGMLKFLFSHQNHSSWDTVPIDLMVSSVKLLLFKPLKLKTEEEEKTSVLYNRNYTLYNEDTPVGVVANDTPVGGVANDTPVGVVAKHFQDSFKYKEWSISPLNQQICKPLWWLIITQIHKKEVFKSMYARKKLISNIINDLVDENRNFMQPTNLKNTSSVRLTTQNIFNFIKTKLVKFSLFEQKLQIQCLLEKKEKNFESKELEDLIANLQSTALWFDSAHLSIQKTALPFFISSAVKLLQQQKSSGKVCVFYENVVPKNILSLNELHWLEKMYLEDPDYIIKGLLSEKSSTLYYKRSVLKFLLQNM